VVKFDCVELIYYLTEKVNIISDQVLSINSEWLFSCGNSGNTGHNIVLYRYIWFNCI
jgi:hypothetical protein